MQPETKTYDLDSWINDLASDDEKLAGSARRRLVARGNLAVERLLAVLSHPQNVGHYRAALRGLGDIAAAGNLQQIASTRQLLLEHLRTHDGAERRSLINCLGSLGIDSQAESALLALWKNEKRDDQLRVLAAALGRVGSRESESALNSCASKAPLVLREVAKSLAAINSRQMRTSAGEGRILGDKVMTGVPIRLRCRNGLVELLLKNLPATMRKAHQTAPGQIDAELHGNLNSLLTCRLWSEFVLRIALPKKQSALESFGAALGGSGRDLLRDLTDGPATWRLQLPNVSRGQLLDLIRAAQRVAPELPNSPNRAVWELRPLANDLELLPRFWRDTRFEYLHESVPAMTHAPLAAALVLLSQPRGDDVVWDPFCGAGTELAERAKAGPYAQLIGSDRDDAALNAARRNLQGIERLSLQAGDALDLRFNGVNVLLTNPPYGRKVQGGNTARLIRMLIDNATRQMKRGRIVFCSPMPEETWTFAQRLGWKALTRLDVSRDEHLLEAQVFVRE